MKKFLLISTAILSFAISESVLAASSGNCGTNCSYTLDDDGVLNIFPTDSSQPASMGTFRDNSAIKSVNIAYGITAIPENAFRSCGNLTSINIPNSVTSIATYAFERTKIKNLVIPSSVNYVSRNIFMFALSTETTTVSAENVDNINFAPHHDHDPVSFGTVICQGCTPEQAQSLENRLNAIDATHSSTQIRENDTQGNTVIKDIYGAYIGGFDQSGNRLDFDQKGNITARYDADGNITKQYAYGVDGSVAVYDAEGNMTSIKAKHITPAQAAAATRKGNNNTVSITW